MTIDDMMDKLIEASDLLYTGTLKGPDGKIGYYGLIFEQVTEDQLKVVLNWWRENIPNLINTYSVNGQEYFQIRDGKGPTGKYIIYLYKTE